MACDNMTYRETSADLEEARFTAAPCMAWSLRACSKHRSRHLLNCLARSLPSVPQLSCQPCTHQRGPVTGKRKAPELPSIVQAKGFASQAAVQQAPNTVYQVRIATGDVRGAGTSAAAAITLFGDGGESETFTIGASDEEWGFERGSFQSYNLDVGRDLGGLRRMHVRQVEPSISDAGSGWYLDKVEVTSPDGSVLNFPCHGWLGRPDSGDLQAAVYMARNLIPASEDHPTESMQLLSQPLVVHASAVSVPHPEKVRDGTTKAVNKRHHGYAGEDAYFCTSGPTGIAGLGVADGVYMWKMQGIDSGEYSKSLMQHACKCVEKGKPDVFAIMQAAARNSHAAGIKGSSTCCIVLIDTLTGRLTSANLGDSGFMVLGSTLDKQEAHVKFRTPQQEHDFGHPYQLGHLEAADKPDESMLMTLPVLPGDVVVMGSDGLFDNLPDDQILSEVQAQLRAGRRPSMIAQHLTALAFNNSIDKQISTPYSMGATEAFNMVYSGGKQDDITVIVAYMQ